MSSHWNSNIELLNDFLDGDQDSNPDSSQSDDPVVSDWPENTPDPRLMRTSYSSGLLFRGCERKYQLQKMSLRQRNDDWKSRLTFGFGHAVGEGIQNILMGKSYESIIFDMFVKWTEDIYAENEAQKKTFFHAMLALQKFKSMQEDGFLDDYELVYYAGKPAAELSFRINLPHGFTERGFVDIVLRNTTTGKFAIFEIKTDSGYNLQPAKYKNSAQATGYSVILDKIEPGHTDYTVYYLVYMTRKEEWECFEFPKTMQMRAQWIQDKLYDTEQIVALVRDRGNHGVWPIRGQHCVTYNKECEFMGTCQLTTKNIVQPLRQSHLEDEPPYDFEFHFSELLS